MTMIAYNMMYVYVHLIAYNMMYVYVHLNAYNMMYVGGEVKSHGNSVGLLYTNE